MRRLIEIHVKTSSSSLIPRRDLKLEGYSCESIQYPCLKPENYKRLFRQSVVEKSVVFKTKPEVLKLDVTRTEEEDRVKQTELK